MIQAGSLRYLFHYYGSSDFYSFQVSVTFLTLQRNPVWISESGSGQGPFVPSTIPIFRIPWWQNSELGFTYSFRSRYPEFQYICHIGTQVVLFQLIPLLPGLSELLFISLGHQTIPRGNSQGLLMQIPRWQISTTQLSLATIYHLTCGDVVSSSALHPKVPHLRFSYMLHSPLCCQIYKASGDTPLSQG